MKSTKKIMCFLLFVAGSLAATPVVAAETHGVTDDTITLGTIQDLSGPLAQLSKEALNGMLMAVDEVNADGGVNGRKLELKVADHGYQPQKAVLAARRMIQREHIFAVIQEMGSVTTMATIPVLEQSNVLSLFPLSGDAATYLPRDRLKWSTSPPYAVGSRMGVKYLVDHNDYKKVCVTYQNDEYGSEVLRGVDEILPYKNAKLVLKVSFPRGTTNFTSNVAKLKAAGCDLVVIGAALREPVAIMKTAQKLGWHPAFLGNTGTFSRRLPELGGAVTNGLYAPGLIHMPYTDGAASKDLEQWAQAYHKRFGLTPDVFGAYGYMSIKLFAHIAKDAGKDLTVDSFIKAIEQTKFDDKLFGASFEFSAKQHEGLSTMFLSKVENGKWTPVTDPMPIKRRWPLGSKYAE